MKNPAITAIRHLAAAALLALAAPATAGVPEAVRQQILPATGAFAAAAEALQQAARADCTGPALKAPWEGAFDAWLGIAHLRFGPLETDGRALAITFWPDPRGLGTRALNGLIAAQDPVISDPNAFAQVSVAARGLMALGRLIHDEPHAGYATGSYRCGLARALATDLALMAAAIDADWQSGTGPELTVAANGQGGSTYAGPQEAARALYTALLTGLEFNADQRLGRPLGSFDRPRPERAELAASGRAQRNILLSLDALEGLALALAGGPRPRISEAFSAARAAVAKLQPDLSGVTSPQGWLETGIAQDRVRAAAGAVRAVVGPALGVGAGFNAADGD